jgi:hypothetical protein
MDTLTRPFQVKINKLIDYCINQTSVVFIDDKLISPFLMFIVCTINLDRYLKKFHKDGAKQSAVSRVRHFFLKKTLSQTKNCSHVSQNVVERC